MSDPIRFLQRVLGRLSSRQLFTFRQECWDREGIRPDRVRTWQTRLGRIFGHRLFSRAYPGIIGRVHFHDTMLQNDSPEELAHYIHVGESAMRNLEESLHAAGRDFADIGTCLDMACGYGRVLRLLQTRIAPEKITACEIEAESVEFLAQEFGVEPLVSHLDIHQVKFPRTYDLIWVGSLFTHLEPAVALDVLKVLVGLLNPRGVLVFSTQGASCLEHIPMYGFMFVEREPMYRAEMASKGVAYSSYYPHWPNYGITMYRQDYLERLMAGQFGEGLKLVRFKERGWAEHQDVWAFQRVG